MPLSFLPSVDPVVISALLLIFLFSGIIKGFLGIGLPTAAMAFLTLVMEPTEAISLLTIPIIATNFFQFIRSSERVQTAKKYKYFDLGPENDNSVDYPDFAHKVAKKVKLNKNNVGILVCGSGTGMNIAANKHKNVRAAQCFNLKSTKLSRLHNDANIITLGSRLLNKKNALNFVNVFLNTKFEGGRHLKRVKKI